MAGIMTPSAAYGGAGGPRASRAVPPRAPCGAGSLPARRPR